MLKFPCVASALLISAVPASAQDPASPTPAPQATSSAKTDVNKIVCKKEQQIGSRLGAKKVCLTVKEWQDRAAEDRVETERIQQATATRSGG